MSLISHYEALVTYHCRMSNKLQSLTHYAMPANEADGYNIIIKASTVAIISTVIFEIYQIS